MDNIIPSEEYTEFEGNVYENPQVSLDASNEFIKNLRDVQEKNNSEITTQTKNLGTEVPSNLGGLVGAESYFTSRYQTPQTENAVASLRAVAQASALIKGLENEQAMWQKRYQDAYNSYQRRAWNSNKNNNGSGGNGDAEGDVTEEETTTEVGDFSTESLAKSRYQKLFAKYIQAGYPVEEAEARAKEDFSNSVDVDAPVEPYQGGK